MKILILAAHPDDEVLGCGGTLARHAREGHDVSVAILGEGVTSRFHRRKEAARDEVHALHDTSQRVADFLGARELHAFGLPDNRFDTLPLLEVVKVVEGLLEQVEPEVVYTQHGGDLNVDHAVLYRATLTATRPQTGMPIREVYAYEVPSSTEWAFQKFEPVFRPNTFVDISHTLDRKVAAMEMYESEARPFPHPRSPEALRATATRWGSVVGVGAAEAFELVRGIQ